MKKNEHPGGLIEMEELIKLLRTHSKRTIGLLELEEIYESYFHTYEEFANFILTLEHDSILQMVKSKGRTVRTPSLAYEYRIDKSSLFKSLHQDLQHYRNQLHPSINLDEYYRKDPHVWEQDLPFLQKIDRYLKTYGFPKETVPAPERSFELVRDEKWITEKRGKEILERVGLFEKLKIIPVSDPLMFAINPKAIHRKIQFHLIVENKTTYQGLLPALKSTVFSTLIYGCGKKIIQSIEQFPNQYPVEGEHYFFYFGDLDREGVLIWHSLSKIVRIYLARPFYDACLKKPPVEGKDYQRQYKEAQKLFVGLFPENIQKRIDELFSQGKYYPQEILKSNELQQIWREYDWKTLI